MIPALFIVQSEDDEMAKLSPEDKKWLQGEIKKIAWPTGWRKARETIISWGTPAAIVGVGVALLAVTCGALYQSFVHVEKETEFRTNTNNSFTKINEQMVSLRALVIAGQPLKKQNQDAAKALLAEARQKSATPIPTSIVRETGTSFVDAAASLDQNVWDTALAFVSYRTQLNANLAQAATADEIATTPVDPNLTTNYRFVSIPGYPLPRLSVGGDVPIDRAALIDKIGEPPLNVGQTRGKQVILVQGGTIGLDTMRMKHVVLRDCSVFYSGGPVQLEDVVFVRCTFVLVNTANARNFSLAVLSESPTKFRV
jgi:hypothetical protein